MNNIETNNLLPCPFCGSSPEWINESIPDDHYYIRCSNGTCYVMVKADRRDKAIGFWNRRADCQSQKAQAWEEKDELRYSQRSSYRILLTEIWFQVKSKQKVSEVFLKNIEVFLENDEKREPVNPYLIETKKD